MAAGISSHINIRSAAPSVMRQDEAAIGTVQVYKRALNKGIYRLLQCDKNATTTPHGKSRTIR